MSRPLLRNSAAYFGGGLITGAILSAYNLWARAEADPLYSSLEGDGKYYAWRDGRIFYKVEGEGPPMVLLHSPHLAASGWEMRKQHAYFGENGYTVYTPDLLGHGLSTRPAMEYSYEVFRDQISDFVRDVVGEPTIVIASSLTSSWTVLAAAQNPDLFSAVVLVEPVGIERNDRRPLSGRLLEGTLRTPGLGQTLFNLLTSKPALTWYAIRRLYLDETHVTDDMLDYFYSMSHQPNARYAPAAFLGGALNCSIREEFAGLRLPILLVWGYQSSDVPPTDGPAFLQVNPRATLTGFDAKLFPHDEAAEAFNTHVERWLRNEAQKVTDGDSLELRVVM